MNEVGLFPTYQACNLVVGVTSPDDLLCQGHAPKGGIIIDLSVTAAVHDHLMTTASEQFYLLFKGHVFPAAMLIAVVDEN